MATIRKRSDRYHAQIRKTGYNALTKTFSSLTTAKRWVSATEADRERNLHVVIPDNIILGELLSRHDDEVSMKIKKEAQEETKKEIVIKIRYFYNKNNFLRIHEGASVNEALDAIGIPKDDEIGLISLNGTSVAKNFTKLAEGDQITIFPVMYGG